MNKRSRYITDDITTKATIEGIFQLRKLLKSTSVPSADTIAQGARTEHSPIATAIAINLHCLCIIKSLSAKIISVVNLIMHLLQVKSHLLFETLRLLFALIFQKIKRNVYLMLRGGLRFFFCLIC